MLNKYMFFDVIQLNSQLFVSNSTKNKLVERGFIDG